MGYPLSGSVLLFFYLIRDWLNLKQFWAWYTIRMKILIKCVHSTRWAFRKIERLVLWMNELLNFERSNGLFLEFYGLLHWGKKDEELKRPASVWAEVRLHETSTFAHWHFSRRPAIYEFKTQMNEGTQITSEQGNWASPSTKWNKFPHRRTDVITPRGKINFR